MDLKTEHQLLQELSTVWNMLDAERAGRKAAIDAAVAAERERGERKLAQAEYLIGAFERGADAAEYGRDIAEFRA